jgi:hypothetical protein
LDKRSYSFRILQVQSSSNIGKDLENQLNGPDPLRQSDPTSNLARPTGQIPFDTCALDRLEQQQHRPAATGFPTPPPIVPTSPHVRSPLSSRLHMLQFATAKLPREGTPLLPRCAPISLCPLPCCAMPHQPCDPANLDAAASSPCRVGCLIREDHH